MHPSILVQIRRSLHLTRDKSVVIFIVDTLSVSLADCKWNRWIPLTMINKSNFRHSFRRQPELVVQRAIRLPVIGGDAYVT